MALRPFSPQKKSADLRTKHFKKDRVRSDCTGRPQVGPVICSARSVQVSLRQTCSSMQAAHWWLRTRVGETARSHAGSLAGMTHAFLISVRLLLLCVLSVPLSCGCVLLCAPQCAPLLCAHKRDLPVAPCLVFTRAVSYSTASWARYSASRRCVYCELGFVA